MLFGSAELALKSDRQPSALREAVCSPGGSTIEGIYALQNGNFFDTVIQATVIAAFGANTVAALETAGFHVAIKAPTSKYASITTAIKDFLDAQNED